MTLPGLFTMLGSPLPLYEASVGHRALELFLADEQCVVLRAGLASLMGPTRADNSWKAESNLPREKLSGWRRRTFANARELEQKMGELQLAEDATSTLGAYQELVRLRGIWSALKAKGKGSFLACDVETYEFVSCSPHLHMSGHTRHRALERLSLRRLANPRLEADCLFVD